jgi:hypothetical protein
VLKTPSMFMVGIVLLMIIIGTFIDTLNCRNHCRRYRSPCDSIRDYSVRRYHYSGTVP